MVLSVCLNGTRGAVASELKKGATALVSVNEAGTDGGNGDSGGPVTSADGRFVVFASSASDLVTNDTPNGITDVFVRDLKTGTTTLLSVNRFGTSGGNDDSRSPVISADGHFVAFASRASDLVATDTDPTRDCGPSSPFGYSCPADVFVRDLQTGTTTLVSVNEAGTDSGNAFSGDASISADGRFVIFRSFASDLVATDTNGTGDMFVRDLQTGTTTLVSVNLAGTDSGNEYSYPGVISADGRFVAFESLASDLVATDTNGVVDVFVRDLRTGTTTLVSVNEAGTDSARAGLDPDDNPNGSYLGLGSDISKTISPDGRFVAFLSFSADLVAIDTNTGWSDVFVRDLKKGTTTLVSINRTATNGGNVGSDSPVLSVDGRFVAFHSGASDLVATDTNGAGDIFVRDLKTGTTTLVSLNLAGTDSGSPPKECRPTPLIGGCTFYTGESVDAVMSDDGRFVAFTSSASDLVETDTNKAWDVFVRDLKKGTTTLVSVNLAGTDSGNSDSSGLSMGGQVISADGRFVTFVSGARDLATNQTGRSDLFVRRVR
jgi:Tol biopolymer transport system component